MADFGKELAKANAGLGRVQITHKGRRLYFRGTFPAKNGIGNKREEFASGCVATVDGLKIAKARALEIESQLMLGSFTWKNWGRMSHSGDTVAEWLKRFEHDHWKDRHKTKAKLATWAKGYEAFFRHLPQDKPLTCKVLTDRLLYYKPNSCSRDKCCTVFCKLADFAGLECNLAQYRGNYHSAPVDPRTLPSDEEIVEAWGKIKNPAWRWIFGVMATYGLRDHEAFRLDPSGLQQTPAIAIVGENSKTGAGIVYPFPAEWVELFDLPNIILPNIQEIDSRGNGDLGRKVGLAFLRQKVGFTPYSLRHAWAIRTAKIGVPDTVAAKMMRHSLHVHSQVYHKHFSQRDMEEAWLKIMRSASPVED